MEKQEIIDRLNEIHSEALRLYLEKDRKKLGYLTPAKREAILIEHLRHLINEIEKEEK